MQRHHLLPCQIVGTLAFEPMIAELGLERIGFGDFRRNGLLLPATEKASRRSMMPLHRGPHRLYNQAVEARVAQIDYDWRRDRQQDPLEAAMTALMRIDLLQAALRHRLLSPDRKPIRLNFRDPLGHGLDFTDLDAMADAIWAATAPVIVDPDATPD